MQTKPTTILAVLVAAALAGAPHADALGPIWATIERVDDVSRITVKIDGGGYEDVKVTGVSPMSYGSWSPNKMQAKLRHAYIGTHLRLESDPTDAAFPKRGTERRLYMHAFFSNGRSYGHAQIASGWGRYDPADPIDDATSRTYQAAERQARQALRGFWRDKAFALNIRTPRTRVVYGKRDIPREPTLIEVLLWAGACGALASSSELPASACVPHYSAYETR
ncbi:hypothetical protein K8I61_01110 [bacterium]|nr:hypothetical protein [bacterium]